jgi:enoyl-CoA hydratase
MPSKVLYGTHDGLAWLTLNRPEVHNAIDLGMRDELWALLDAAEADDEVRVVVFRGAGSEAFSSGADISEFGTSPSYTEARRARIERDLWGRVLHFPKPTIAALQGFALGAGCELSLLCDFRVAAENVRMGLPEAKLGYIPTAGGTQTLQRTVGLGRALGMLLSADPIDAATALDFGLVHQIVPPRRLEATAEMLAARLAAQPEQQLRAAKRMLVEGADLPLDTALRVEAGIRAAFT